MWWAREVQTKVIRVATIRLERSTTYLLRIYIDNNNLVTSVLPLDARIVVTAEVEADKTVPDDQRMVIIIKQFSIPILMKQDSAMPEPEKIKRNSLVQAGSRRVSLQHPSYSSHST